MVVVAEATDEVVVLAGGLGLVVVVTGLAVVVVGLIVVVVVVELVDVVASGFG